MEFEFTDICLISDDVPGLAAFYGKVFGVPAEGDDFHSGVRAGGLTLVIDSSSLARYNPAFHYVSGRSSDNVILGFNVHDVDAHYARLRDMGVETLGAPTTHPWGARSFQFRDPDGNIVNFRTVPGEG